jgi:hypothetical protein
MSRGGGTGASVKGTMIVGKVIGASDGRSVSTLGEPVRGGVGSADPALLGPAVVVCGADETADGAPVCRAGAGEGTMVGESVGSFEAKVGSAVIVADGVPVGLPVGAPVGILVEGAPVGDTVGDTDGARDSGALVEGDAERPSVGEAEGTSVGIAEEGGHVGATHAKVSYVVHARRLATPTAACATARTRVAVPAARLEAEGCWQSAPEEHAPAHAAHASPNVQHRD